MFIYEGRPYTLEYIYTLEYTYIYEGRPYILECVCVCVLELGFCLCVYAYVYECLHVGGHMCACVYEGQRLMLSFFFKRYILFLEAGSLPECKITDSSCLASSFGPGSTPFCL